MKQSVNLYQFREAFRLSDRKDQFTYEGLEVLFDYFEQYWDDGGEEYELDVVGLCCEYSEDTYKNIAENYSIDISDLDEDDMQKKVYEHLTDNTMVCGKVDGGLVYQQF